MPDSNRFYLRHASSGGEDNSHKYVAPPSVGHEIGIMFGGIGAMLLGMLLFWIWWALYLKKEEREERARIEGLRQRGIPKEQLIVEEAAGEAKKSGAS